MSHVVQEGPGSISGAQASLILLLNGDSISGLVAASCFLLSLEPTVRPSSASMIQDLGVEARPAVIAGYVPTSERQKFFWPVSVHMNFLFKVLKFPLEAVPIDSRCFSKYGVSRVSSTAISRAHCLCKEWLSSALGRHSFQSG